MLVKDEIARPISEKLGIADHIIHKHFVQFDPELCFVAWSGGKDSTFMLYLVRQHYKDIPVVFNNTGVEFPETVKFVHQLAQDWSLNLIELSPEMTFWQCVEKWGFPLPSRFNMGNKRTGTPKCCYHLKERPIIKLIKERGFKVSFVGVTAWESWGRRLSAGKFGLCHFSRYYGVERVRPILFFRPDEIWYLTREWGIPVNPVYQHIPRVGCMTCTGHIGWEGQMARAAPRLYQLIQERRSGEYQLPLKR